MLLKRQSESERERESERESESARERERGREGESERKVERETERARESERKRRERDLFDQVIESFVALSLDSLGSILCHLLRVCCIVYI